MPEQATVPGVLRELATHPMDCLVRRWNWKAALTSALMRGGIFFSVNLSAGLDAALGVLLTEFVFRTVTSGFYGSIMQAFRRAEPAWAAAVTTLLLLPVCNHTLEWLVHWFRGTPKLAQSIVASVTFTVLSTLFNLYIMRKGVLVVGQDSGSLWDDMKLMPGLVASFVAAGPLAIYRRFSRAGTTR
jgi:ABC-type amino acid transport system permease subunit